MDITPVEWGIVISLVTLIFGVFKYMTNNINKKIDKKVDEVVFSERMKVQEERFLRYSDRIDNIYQRQKDLQRSICDQLKNVQQNIDDKVSLILEKLKK